VPDREAPRVLPPPPGALSPGPEQAGGGQGPAQPVTCDAERSGAPLRAARPGPQSDARRGGHWARPAEPASRPNLDAARRPVCLSPAPNHPSHAANRAHLGPSIGFRTNHRGDMLATFEPAAGSAGAPSSPPPPHRPETEVHLSKPKQTVTSGDSRGMTKSQGEPAERELR
jgi:hypothetical protein